jgi:hypothetical protein
MSLMNTFLDSIVGLCQPVLKYRLVQRGTTLYFILGLSLRRRTRVVFPTTSLLRMLLSYIPATVQWVTGCGKVSILSLWLTNCVFTLAVILVNPGLGVFRQYERQ